MVYFKDDDGYVVPHCLTKMKGGVNVHDQTNSIIENIYNLLDTMKQLLNQFQIR